MVGFGIFSILILVLGSLVLGLLNAIFSLAHATTIVSLLVCCLMVYLAISMTGPLAPFFVILIIFIFIFIAATK